jgi:thioredoxin-related protein/glyoxylase-like metal-dependent hydrolase (beta-lactamase superfamily II)
MMRYFLFFLFLTSYLFSFDYHLKPYIISDGVNCFFGLPSAISKDNGGNMINSCYIETDDGYIVIDSGPTYSYAQSTYEIMKKKSNLPVKYVINTSSDEVHILGNDFFKEQGAILIGSTNYKKHLIKNKKLLITDKISKDALFNTRLIPLDKYLENDLSLSLGDVKVDIIKVKSDYEYLIVHIPSKKIVFAGDMIFNNRIVAFKNNRSILVWLKGLELLKSLSWDDIVSAHGYMTRRSALKHTENYLSLLKSEVKSSVASGESREDAIANIKLSAFSEDRLYKFWHSKNVGSVYDELKKKYKVNKVSKTITVTPSKKVSEVKRTVVKKKFTPKIIEKKIKKNIADVQYVSFNEAIRNAKNKNKIIFLKVRSTTCKYCDKLDDVIASDKSVKDILNNYFEMVSINNDYENVPYNIRIENTPTLIFFKSGSEEPLMNLKGINALGEFLEVLKEVVDDGHKGGYLKP